MADSIPAALKQADVNLWKCAQKAAQLRGVKPIVAYWCEYWVANQILARGLHLADDELMRYTASLMDRMEETKREHGNEDTLTDDAISQAYVEQFAQETLDRAERVVKANKVTQQTASTFDAAATFFQLVNIWGPPDQETQQKIKYAKWNAARILKAIREGVDPNESNPKQEEVQPQQPDELAALERELAGGAAIPRPATVEDAPDADLRRDAAGVSLPHSPASGVPSPASDDGLQLPGVPTGIRFFDSPSIPSPVSPPSNDASAPDLPQPPPGGAWPNLQPSPEASPPPSAWSQPPANLPPASPWGQTPTGPTNPPTFSMNTPSTTAVASPPVSPPTDPYYMPTAHTVHTTHTSRPPAPPVVPPPASYTPVQPSAAVDEAAMANAQKHAKWAISALNFEDVPTAVKELRKALELLGAT
ncbi:vacuolar protein sorting-associated protein vts1 [Podospora fimiseda]|uniref:Vacuolar protein sorting-associated protein vts1 n=1 Tax=Podospora fimiseda TaxID=252190 RepID=A0AAN7BWY0_9PEZI|nr:vacuolar protein sorting-associated protein vts1 [Podospora fimiseda]